MPLLEVHQLRKRYHQRDVLDIGRLEVGERETLAVLGPNGSGKSTLFRLLLMLEPATSGTILLDGAPLTAAVARRRMAGVFQRPYLFSGTVRDNVRYGLRVRHYSRAEQLARAEQALQELNLTAVADRHVRDISGGEMQRVALARALACSSDILLLDEPTAALDVTAQRGFREDLARVARARGVAVVLITHDPADAFALADRIAVLENGCVVQSGTPIQLMSDPGTPFVAAFSGAELLLDGVIDRVADGLVGVRVAPDCVVWAGHAGTTEIGAVVHVSYQPEDVALSTGPIDSGLSARNVFTLTVDRVTVSQPLVRVALTGTVPLVAIITRRSAEQLGITAGRSVNAHLKAAAVRAFAVNSP